MRASARNRACADPRRLARLPRRVLARKLELFRHEKALQETLEGIILFVS